MILRDQDDDDADEHHGSSISAASIYLVSAKKACEEFHSDEGPA